MFRILTIDGGGIKGVFAAAFLAYIERHLEQKNSTIADYFDLIAGTSTGGIIALGLGFGMSAQDILAFYEQKGPEIFQKNTYRYIPFIPRRGLLDAKYDSAPLQAALENIFGNSILYQSKKRLLIPALNLVPFEIILNKTRHHSAWRRDQNKTFVEIALQTAAAPVFFNPHRGLNGLPIVDGGLWANNPCDIAVIEAMTVLKQPRESIQVLSLGCTGVLRDFANLIEHNRGGFVYWRSRLMQVLLDAQSEASTYKAERLIHQANLFRINPVFGENAFAIDNAKNITILKGVGETQAANHYTTLRQVFFRDPVSRFTPLPLDYDYIPPPQDEPSPQDEDENL
jgi:patatin-like phospholipase/acyl hydrolase